MTNERPRLRRALAAIAATAAIAVTLAACGSSGSDPTNGSGGAAGEPVAGGTLVFGRTAAVNDLNLHTQIAANNAFAIDKIFEPLVSFDESGEIIPWLADYAESDDELTYTFTLRNGLMFSDGNPVTADDVVFSLETHQAVADSPLPLTAPIESIEAASETEVVITLDEPYTPFLSELSNFSNGVLPADFGGKSEAEFFENPIGTGPFVLNEWDKAGDISFTKNENYWQEGKPYLDALEYRYIADDTQLRQQLAAGQLDAIDIVPAANAAEIEADSSLRLSQTEGWSAEQVFFNTERAEFADVKVRRAIAMALDREGITQATTFGTAETASALLPPSIQYSAADDDIALPYDVAAAQAELAGSDFPDGFEFSLMVPSGNTQRAQIAQAIQEQLSEIGITVNIEQLEIATFRERFFAYDFDAMINNGQSDAPDPNGFITFQADPEGFSQSYWTHYTNDTVTALMEAGRVTPNGDERAEIYLDIQKQLAQDAPYIPLFYPANLKATTSNVAGFTVLPNGSVRFADTWRVDASA